MAPTLEQLTARFESACETIQDSITIIESQMGSQQEFTFNINREIFSLEAMDISTTECDVNRYIVVLEEYKKMLSYEKSRRRLDFQIKNAGELKTIREELKNKRQGRRVQNQPYKKNSPSNTA